KDLTYLASFVEKYLQELKEGIIKNTAESRHLKELLYLMKYNLELEQPLFFKKIWSLLEPEEKKTDTETEEVIIEKDNGENYKQMMTKKLSERDRTVYLTKEFEKHASEIGKRIGTDLKLDDDLTEKLTTAIKENKEFSPRTKRILLIKEESLKHATPTREKNK
ncbi:10312_t:CDS:2, partial [Funneliformis geosporum]